MYLENYPSQFLPTNSFEEPKDVHGSGSVRVVIETEWDSKSPQITFKHSGQPFTTDNIRFLIEQISTKDRKKDDNGKQKTTGKFGTGFLTTHLLSEKVHILGVAKEPDLDYRQFSLVLDRTGFDIDAITEGVRTAKLDVENLDDTPPYRGYVAGALNTEFLYALSDDLSRKIAKAGIADLKRCIPFTLVFVRELESVTVDSQKYTVQLKETNDIPPDGVTVVTIAEGNLAEPSTQVGHSLAIIRRNFTTIAIPVRLSNDTIEITPIHDLTPRLFCEFPLIGTEQFPFPAVVNNPNFNPTDPRDGVFLNHTERRDPGIEENKLIILEAVALYFELLKYASENGWKNLHLLADLRSATDIFEWLDQKWGREQILLPIRKLLLRSKIVRTADNDALASIQSDDGTKFIWFPRATTREIRDRIWLCCNDWFPHCLPKRSDVELWNGLVWEECGKLTVGQLAKFVESKKTAPRKNLWVSGRLANPSGLL